MIRARAEVARNIRDVVVGETMEPTRSLSLLEKRKREVGIAERMLHGLGQSALDRSLIGELNLGNCSEPEVCLHACTKASGKLNGQIPIESRHNRMLCRGRANRMGRFRYILKFWHPCLTEKDPDAVLK